MTGSTSAVTVEAPATAVVMLRNLYLTGTGANKGVNFKTGKALHVDGCVVNGFSQGVRVGGGPGGVFYLRNSNTANCNEGVLLEPTGSDSSKPTTALIERSHFENYFKGVTAAGRYEQMIIRDSTFVGRSKDPAVTYGGILASPLSPGTTNIMVENSLISNNHLAVGTTTTGVAFISISQNVIYGDQLGTSVCCFSKMITFGNNRFENNDDDGSFNLSTPLK